MGKDLNLVMDGNWKERGLDLERDGFRKAIWKGTIWETDLEGNIYELF